jgi:hypothetical protein
VGICACDAQTDEGHRRGGAAGGHAQVPGSSDGIRAEKTFPDPDATRRRRNGSPRRMFAPSCAMRRRAVPSPRTWKTRHILQPRQQERPHAPRARTAPRQPHRSASRHADFARISADVIGFVSQFFFIDPGSLSSSTLLLRRRQGWRAAIGASRQSARLAPIPPRGVRHDNSHSPGEGVLADRRDGPRAATPTGSGEFNSS